MRLLVAWAEVVGEADEQTGADEHDAEDGHRAEADGLAEQQPHEEAEARGTGDGGTEVTTERRRGHHEERDREHGDHRVHRASAGPSPDREPAEQQARPR